MTTIGLPRLAAVATALPLLDAPMVADRATTSLDRRDSGMRLWAAQPGRR